jgi:hypothetical protein
LFAPCCSDLSVSEVCGALFTTAASLSFRGGSPAHRKGDLATRRADGTL